MLTENEIRQIREYSEKDPVLSHLFTRIQEEEQFTLSKVSHEIRNPVTLINSFMQMLSAKHPEVEDFTYWDNIMEHMDFLKILLDELSQYNNAGTLHLTPVAFDCFLEDLLHSLRPTLRYLHMELSLEKQGSNFMIPIDVPKFKEVLLNLIRNSYESIDSDGRIQILLKSSEDALILTISDNGCGIPEEYMPTLFDPFVTHKKGGTGLGLAIAKQITLAHGGTITAASHPGEGTQFSISIPRT